MPRSSFKQIFEFFLRLAPDVSGQTAETGIPRLEKQVLRFLRGDMARSERASFFQSIRLSPQAIESLAKRIRRKAGTRRTGGPSSWRSHKHNRR